TLEQAREQIEGLTLPALAEAGLSPAEARIEAKNAVARFERMAVEAVLNSMMSDPQDPCRTTQHCAYHGWCHRCDPRFSALMSEINLVIQTTTDDQSAWGGLYGRIAKVLHGSAEVRLAAELAETKRTQVRLERELKAVRRQMSRERDRS